MRGAAADLAGLLEGPGGEGGAAEVGGVEAAAEDGLVHGAQLGEGEGGPQQRVPDAGSRQVRAQARHGRRQDLRVVERQRGRRVGPVPAHMDPDGQPGHVRVRAGRRGGAVVVQGGAERPVGHREDASGGGAVHGAERRQLLEATDGTGHALGGHACGDVGQLLVRAEPRARQRPPVQERLAHPRDEGDAEAGHAVRVRAHAEDGRGHGDADAGLSDRHGTSRGGLAGLFWSV